MLLEGRRLRIKSKRVHDKISWPSLLNTVFFDAFEGTYRVKMILKRSFAIILSIQSHKISGKIGKNKIVEKFNLGFGCAMHSTSTEMFKAI